MVSFGGFDIVSHTKFHKQGRRCNTYVYIYLTLPSSSSYKTLLIQNTSHSHYCSYCTYVYMCTWVHGYMGTWVHNSVTIPTLYVDHLIHTPPTQPVSVTTGWPHSPSLQELSHSSSGGYWALSGNTYIYVHACREKWAVHHGSLWSYNVAPNTSVYFLHSDIHRHDCHWE